MLYLAAVANSGYCVTQALSLGADPNSTDLRTTALIAAGSSGNADAVNALIAGRADVNLSYYEKTPLMAAAEGGTAEIVNALLAANADVRPTMQTMPNSTFNGKPDPNTTVTALSLAMRSANWAVANILIAAKSDPNARIGVFQGPCIFFAMVQNIPTMKALIEAGASPNVLETEDGRSTSLLVAAKARYGVHSQIVEYLKSHGAVDNP